MLGFACVLLSKTLRSSTLKLAFIYVTAFSSDIFAVLGYVYWSTSSYISKRSDRALTTESTILVKAYASAGRNGLVALINQRMADPFFDDWAYLLTEDSFTYIAGNLTTWPASLRADQGWSDFSPATWPKASARPQFRATYQVLPGGYRLLLARKVDDLGRFRDWIGISLAWAAGLFLLLAMAAGISTSRRSVARIETINATSRQIIQTGLRERIPLRGTGDEWDELAELRRLGGSI